MTSQGWIALGGIMISALAALIPWLVAVHAKLAAIATRVADLCAKLEQLASAYQERLEMCIQHESRLGAHEVQIADLGERLREMQ